MKISFSFMLLAILLNSFTACQKDNNSNTDTNKILVIENGAVNAKPDESINYTAVLIDIDGNRTIATNVEWTSSDNSVVSITSNGATTINSTGNIIITAKVDLDGVILTTTAPLQIQVPSLFAVAPSAILVDQEFPNIQLNAVYLGTTSTSYTYSSSNTAVATVNSTGDVDFIGVGNCQITVTATGLNSTFIVPVTVLGVPSIQLPIARVIISPDASELLKTETSTSTAKAYDLDGNEVSTSFQWSIDDSNIATVDANGQITAVAVGSTKIRAMAEGIIGTAEVNVYPNNVLIIDPIYTTIAPGNSKTFTAKKHPVTRVNGELTLGAGTSTTNINWSIPTYGFSLFDIATVDNNGNVTMKQNAQVGLLTVLLATDLSDSEVVGSASVGVSLASSCNCGTADPNASSIQLVSSSTVSLGLGQTSQIQANVLDGQGNIISGANLVYCSDDIQVADVSSTGEISSTSFLTNTTNITVCHGSLSKTITVNIP